MLEIEGMVCPMCESHINEVIRNGFDIKSVKTDRRKKICEIISENGVDFKEAKKAIENTGYSVTSFRSEEFEKKTLFFKLFKK